MQVFENFCSRAGLKWGGGTGIGGGVMLNVTRIGFIVEFTLLLVNMLLSGFQTGNFFPEAALINFAENMLILLFLNSGVLLYLFQMAKAVRQGTFSGKKYTRIMLPSFVFIIFADIFFIIVSIIKGGIFRGWLAKKDVDEAKS